MTPDVRPTALCGVLVASTTSVTRHSAWEPEATFQDPARSLDAAGVALALAPGVGVARASGGGALRSPEKK